MPATPELLTIDPNGLALVTVDIFDEFDVSVTAYTTSGGSTAHDLPLAITTSTAFYLTASGTYSLSIKLDGVEIALGSQFTVSGGVPAVYQANPITVQRLAAVFAAKVNVAPAINSQTDEYTLVLSDAGKIVEITIPEADPNVAAFLTVPPNDDVAFPIGTTITLVQGDQTQIDVQPGVGVTLDAAASTVTGEEPDLVTHIYTKQIFSVAWLYKRDTNRWMVYGGIGV